MLTPDDLVARTHPLTELGGPSLQVTIFDDDHFYLGGVLAELLASRGHVVRLVTPAPLVSSWTAYTLELGAIQRRVRDAGVIVEVNRAVTGIGEGEARLACVFTGTESSVKSDAVVLVTARLPLDGLFTSLEERKAEWGDRGVRSVRCAGDAWAPTTIAGAVWSGRRYAEEFDTPAGDGGQPSFSREYTALTSSW